MAFSERSGVARIAGCGDSQLVSVRVREATYEMLLLDEDPTADDGYGHCCRHDGAVSLVVAGLVGPFFFLLFFSFFPSLLPTFGSSRLDSKFKKD